MPKALDLFSHTGGLKTNVSPFLYRSTETPYSVNVRTDTELGSLTKATQYSQYINDAGNNAIQGIFPFEAADSTKKLFMASNGVIYEDDAGTWTSRDTGLSTSAKFESAMFYDKVYVTNGVDNLRYSSNGTTWNTVALTPKYVDVFRNRLYSANFGGSDRNKFKYSDLGDGTTTNNTVATIEDAITGLKATFNYVYFFTAKDFWRWDEAYLVKVDNIGCTSHRSIQAGNGLLFFANKEGVWVTDGNRPELISRPVQYWWDGITDANFDDLNGVFFDNEYYLWVGTSQSEANVVLVYNTLYQNWRVMTGWPSNVMATWTNGTDSQDLYFGNNTADSLVYIADTSYDQGATVVTATYDYPILFPAGPDKEFWGTSLHCYAESAGNPTFQIQYALNWSDDFKTLDEWTLQGLGFPEHHSIDIPKYIQGRAVQWRIKESTSTNAWFWHGMKMYYEETLGRSD